jgi:hypothetical protein
MMRDHPGADLREHSVIEPGIGKVRPQRISP